MNKKFVLNLFDYNKWRFDIYSSKLASKSSLDFLAHDHGLPFASLKGTFTHLLLADYLWIMRMKNNLEMTVPFSSESQFPKESLKYSSLIKLWQGEGDFHSYYNEDPYEWFKFHQLRFSDSQSFLKALANTVEMDSTFTYRDSKGTELTKHYGDVFYHLINHHTHHLGQASVAYVKEFGYKDFPETDFIYFIEEKGNNKH